MTKNPTVEKLIAALPGGTTRANLARILRQVESLAIYAANSDQCSKGAEIEEANALALFADGYLAALIEEVNHARTQRTQ